MKVNLLTENLNPSKIIQNDKNDSLPDILNAMIDGEELVYRSFVDLGGIGVPANIPLQGVLFPQDITGCLNVDMVVERKQDIDPLICTL